MYRNINTVDKFFGLELADGCVLLLAFFLIFMVNRNSLFTNALALLLVYLGLWALKRGKPDGYLVALLRYALSGRFKIAVRFEEVETP